jgi:hypothetical protein
MSVPSEPLPHSSSFAIKSGRMFLLRPSAIGGAVYAPDGPGVSMWDGGEEPACQGRTLAHHENS